MAATVGTLKILMVDKDRSFADSLVGRFRGLKEFSFAVDHSASGAEMLDKVYRQSYDLIFLDMDLPDMNGLEVLSRVGQTTLPLPIVTMAQNANARLAVEVMKRGVLDFLLKEDLVVLDMGGLLRRLLESFRLRRENAELQQINQMKDDFLATISHELRTPLTSILGLSEVLLAGRMGALQEKQAESLKKILDQCHHLVRLINELLDVRAFMTEGAKADRESLSLQDMVVRQVSALRPLFEKKGVKVELSKGEDPLFVQADRRNLDKVVEHLISNALKFTARGGRVNVEARKMDSGHVQVKIVDDGRGIPPEALPHIFEKFFHADQSLTRPYGGMGLGLAFCKDVVEAHGGRIWVESKGVWEGTLVSFLLPGQRAPLPSAAAPAAAPAREEHKKTVLWVDDNPNLLELVEYGFAGFSHAVNLLTAQTGVAAIAQLQSRIPDLIVLDIMMTDMDGLELLERLRKDPQTQKVPILVVSGYQKAIRTAMDRGASDYCLKPFRVQDVMKKIEALLGVPAKA